LVGNPESEGKIFCFSAVLAYGGVQVLLLSLASALGSGE